MSINRYRDQLDDEIKKWYHKTRLTRSDRHAYNMIAHQIKDTIFKSSGQKPEVHLFGSSVNGFGAEGCDLDIALIFQTSGIKQKNIINSVDKLDVHLKGDTNISNKEVISSAKVPIIKLKYLFNGTKYDCDLSLSNYRAILNSEMLLTYSKVDEVVQIIGLFVKEWAKRNNICGHQHLSSFSWVIAVIHYLQNEGVLPYLQDIDMPAKKSERKEYYFKDIDNLNQYFKPKNIDSLSELLFGLFNYYGNVFDYRFMIILRRSRAIINHQHEGLGLVRKPIVERKKGDLKFRFEQFDPKYVSATIKEANAKLPRGSNKMKEMTGEALIKMISNN